MSVNLDALGTITIINDHLSFLDLAVTKEEVPNGQKVMATPSFQRWNLLKNSNEYYMIKNEETDLFLQQDDEGVLIAVDESSVDDSKLWAVTPVKESQSFYLKNKKSNQYLELYDTGVPCFGGGYWESSKWNLENYDNYLSKVPSPEDTLNAVKKIVDTFNELFPTTQGTIFSAVLDLYSFFFSSKKKSTIDKILDKVNLINDKLDNISEVIANVSYETNLKQARGTVINKMELIQQAFANESLCWDDKYHTLLKYADNIYEALKNVFQWAEEYLKNFEAARYSRQMPLLEYMNEYYYINAVAAESYLIAVGELEKIYEFAEAQRGTVHFWERNSINGVTCAVLIKMKAMTTHMENFKIVSKKYFPKWLEPINDKNGFMLKNLSGKGVLDGSMDERKQWNPTYDDYDNVYIENGVNHGPGVKWQFKLHKISESGTYPGDVKTENLWEIIHPEDESHLIYKGEGRTTYVPNGTKEPNNPLRLTQEEIPKQKNSQINVWEIDCSTTEEKAVLIISGISEGTRYQLYCTEENSVEAIEVDPADDSDDKRAQWVMLPNLRDIKINDKNFNIPFPADALPG